MKKVGKIKVNDRLKESIILAVGEIGGFGKFIKKGEKVLLKANFNTADPFPGSTDPEFLRTVVGLIFEAGAGEVIVGGSSTMMANTREVMEELGVFELEKLNPPPRIINFDENKWRKRKIPQGKYLKSISMPKILDSVDKLIYLPCCKTHFIARFTGALKLTVGLMRPRERAFLHMGHVQEKIAEMNTVVSPDLIIMDARKVFIADGPMSGPTEEPGLILASESRLDIDIAGVNIIKCYLGNNLVDVRAEDLEQIKLACELGVD